MLLSESLMIVHVMIIDTLSMEEKLSNLTKVIEHLTKYVYNQDTHIDKLMDKMGVLMDRESNHACE